VQPIRHRRRPVATTTHAALQRLKLKIEELKRLSDLGAAESHLVGSLNDPVGHYDLPHSDTNPGHFDVAHWDGQHGDRIHLDGYGDTGHDDAFHDDTGHDDGGHDDGGHDDGGHDDGGHDDGGHDDGGHDDGGHDDGGHDDGGHDDGGHDDGGHDDEGHEDDSSFWDRIDWLMHEMEVVLTVFEKGVIETIERKQAQAFTETNRAIEELSQRIAQLEAQDRARPR
jgi:hypothetical protein